MSRLDALVAALPKILPVVENITDDMFRDRVFDALVQAAIDDAATPTMLPAPVSFEPGQVVPDSAIPEWESQLLNERTAREANGVGTVYGNSVGRVARSVDTAAFNILVNPDVTPADLGTGTVVTPMVVDLDNGQRLTGTYEGDANGGTFTPTTGTDRTPWAAGAVTPPPSDSPVYDDVARQRP